MIRSMHSCLCRPAIAALICCVCYSTHASRAQSSELRGFGTIGRSTTTLEGLEFTVFTCENSEKAVLLAHKFGRDMQQSATIPAKWEHVQLGDSDANILVRAGIGSFLPAASGADVLVFSSPKTTDLSAAFAAAAPKLKGARFYDPAYQYPAFYDKFSSTGIGSWYPSYWNDAYSKGHLNSVDEHFAYAREQGLSLQIGGDYVFRNLLPKLREYARPYHIAQWLEWSSDLALMAPDELVSPGSDFTTMPHYYGQISEGGHKLLQYRNWCFESVMRQHVDNPLLVDWNDPNGEVGPAPFFYFWDFSEANRQNLVQYLRDVKKYTPQSLGAAWRGNDSYFKTWDDVKIPAGYAFFGWREGDVVANRSWRVQPASPTEDTNYDGSSWPELKNDLPANLRKDIDSGFSSVDFSDAGWAEFSRPGGELASIYFGADSKHFNKFFWRRGTIEATQNWIDRAKTDGRIYLSVVALNVNLGPKLPDRLWFNGTEAAAISSPPGTYAVTQIDVTDLIKPGVNRIAHLANVTWYSSDGPYFLTTRKMEAYPFTDSHLNARYIDWHDYIAWCVNQKMEDTYKAMRAIDRDRPFKMMAAYDKDTSIPLAAKYGCFPHNTGEGSSFRPWDKRFGYVYGIPSSAEFGGSIVEPAAWKRWLGWFTFEGNNAFDNFHNIHAMMYSPVRDLWLEYLPYLKLANRSDLKKPQIALFWSSENVQLLPHGTPYSFDLGRGDLHFIGQSNVYVDEAGVRNGLLNKYPVVWDTGTWIMDPTTVAGLKKYVEEGGTYVALQETGRHTFTRRDAWPITDLTGFKVRESRPMTGTVSILTNQPLFKHLAGKNFNNFGTSVDYSDYNNADACVALEPLTADTTAIARYQDGSIAIGMRKLGRGKVITLGSPFWRDSRDRAGMWWPGESQNDFLEDIFESLGIKPVAKADTRDVWREHYLANNGTEEYLALFNPSDKPRTFSVEWNTVQPAGALFDPKNGKKIDGTIDGNKVTLNQITLDGLETRIVAATSKRAPQEAMSGWFDHLALWSRPSAPGAPLTRPDLPSFSMQLAPTMKGKAVSKSDLAALDIAALSKTADPGAGFELWAGQSFEENRSKPDPDRRFILHNSVSIPTQWKPADSIELVVSAFTAHSGAPTDDAIDAYVNGIKVISRGKSASNVAASIGSTLLAGGITADISKSVNWSGPNTVCIVTATDGFMGEIKLRRRPAVLETLDVTGTVSVQLDADAGTAKASIPGVVKGLYAWKDDLIVPASWKGSRVFVNISLGNEGEYDSFAINEKVILHPVSWFKPVTWMDVTPWIKFGEPNKLTLISRKATKDWMPGTPHYKSVKLERVDLGAL